MARIAQLLSRCWSTVGAVSSVGRAPARQAGGHWFEPSTAHYLKAPLRRGFCRLGGAPGKGDLRGVATKWQRSPRRSRIEQSRLHNIGSQPGDHWFELGVTG